LTINTHKKKEKGKNEGGERDVQNRKGGKTTKYK